MTEQQFEALAKWIETSIRYGIAKPSTDMATRNGAIVLAGYKREARKLLVDR